MSNRAQKTPPRPGRVSTLVALAQAIDKGERTVARWKAEGMPSEDDGSYSVADVLAWRADLDARREAERLVRAGGQEWEARYQEARASLLELELVRVAGRLIGREQVEQFWQQRRDAIARELKALTKTLPRKLVKLAARKIKTVIDMAVHDLRQRMSEGSGSSKSEQPKLDQAARDLSAPERYERARALLREIELDKAKGELIDRAGLEREWADRILNLVNALVRMGQQLAPQIESRTLAKIKSLLGGYIDTVRKAYTEQPACSMRREIRRGPGRPRKEEGEAV